ncbi:MAG: HAD family hydrolase, partial [Candidatus Aminicenantes bacterium]|nr:HAD family hydrolase [Candidatus Aminicenantes bacterium]
MKKKAVFLDRDGTINKDVGYPASFSVIEIYSFSFEAIKKINEIGLLAVITTNQSGVGRGLIVEKNLHDIHRKLRDSFAERNAHFDGIYYCPHYLLSSTPQYRKDCHCRKPNPGMALQAATDLKIDLKNSYMIGDKVEDILFGLNIQAKSILVLTGYGKESLPKLKKKGIKPAFVAQTLLDAV